jgi:hypothetical protein
MLKNNPALAGICTPKVSTKKRDRASDDEMSDLDEDYDDAGTPPRSPQQVSPPAAKKSSPSAPKGGASSSLSRTNAKASLTNFTEDQVAEWYSVVMPPAHIQDFKNGAFYMLWRLPEAVETTCWVDRSTRVMKIMFTFPAPHFAEVSSFGIEQAILALASKSDSQVKFAFLVPEFVDLTDGPEKLRNPHYFGLKFNLDKGNQDNSNVVEIL